MRFKSFCYIQILNAFIVTIIFLSCNNNSTNSTSNDEIEQTPTCNAIVTIRPGKILDGGSYRVSFKIDINNIGERVITGAGGKYKVTHSDYSTWTGSVSISSIELPPGITHRFAANMGLGADYFYMPKSSTIETYDIYYRCL